jgi:hypothetical protein
MSYDFGTAPFVVLLTHDGGNGPAANTAGDDMSDPNKAPGEPKKDELNAEELDGVSGGAIDAFLDFTTSRDTYTDKPPVTKKNA